MSVIDRVRRFARQHDLFRPETRLLAAVSGGSDSTALGHLLSELARQGELRLVGLVHFNHRLRASAGADERFVREVADSLQVPFVASRENVKGRARRDRRSLEDAARVARYRAFARARVRLGADVVALGHTKDDQAETFLLRLLRGAGPRGLAGMYPRRAFVVRPLLDCRRAELRSWLDERGLRYVEDETNQDVTIPRNRVRLELLPLLVARFNPRIVDVLAGEAELAAEIWAWMTAASESLVGPREMDVARLGDAPAALRAAAMWRAMSAASGGRPVSYAHVKAALELLSTEDGAAVDAPGQRVQRVGGRIVLTSRQGGRGRGREVRGQANLFRVPLSIPGRVEVPTSGWTVTVEAAPAALVAPPGAITGNGSVAVVRRDLVRGSLAVRNRRPGDRFRPVGLRGWKKLQDLFVDRKIARDERDGVPLVVDADDRIVWVAGHGIDEAFRVTDPSQAVLILKLKALGGSA